MPVVAPQSVGDFRMERLGNERWLSTTLSPEQVFPQVRAFWKDNGFTLVQDRADAGVIETDWAENRAKLPHDIIRSTIGKVIDSVYSTGELDKFRTRVERTPTGSDIYITHRGMAEVYTNSLKEQTVWQTRPADPQLEATFLSRLMIKLGCQGRADQDRGRDRRGREQAAASAASAAPATPARARIIEGQPTPTLQLDDGFDRAWRRVGIALDRSGFTVEDRDRAQGLYFVRYVDPAFAGREDPNFFSRMFGLGGKTEDTGLAKYRVKVSAEGTTSNVAVLRLRRQAGDDGERQAHRHPPARRPALGARGGETNGRAEAGVIRFCSLGSGSSGNATVVEATSGITTTRLLVDAGFSLRELETRLARAGLAIDDLDAVFVTHEHNDHIGCALALAERHGLALFMSRGTWRAIGAGAPPPHLRFARDGEALAVGDLTLHPFTVAHDAAEPLQLRCGDGNALLAVLTDLGSITAHMLDNVRGLDALVLECNHDAAMLAVSRYPDSLKARIGGRFGHLSNDTATRAARPRRRCAAAPPRRRASEPREQPPGTGARRLGGALGQPAGGHRRRRSVARLRLAADRLKRSARAAGNAKSRPEAAFGGSCEPSYFIAPEAAVIDAEADIAADEAASIAEEAALIALDAARVGRRRRHDRGRRRRRRRRRRGRLFLLAAGSERNGGGQSHHQQCCFHISPRFSRVGQLPVIVGTLFIQEPHRLQDMESSSISSA